MTKKILVMDDDEFICEFFGEVIEDLGFTSAFASEGQEALDMYAQAMEQGEPFALVIIDLNIPGGMGGMETMEALQAMDPDINALVSSGNADDPAVSNYRAHGFSGIITKPFGIEELEEKILSLVGP